MARDHFNNDKLPITTENFQISQVNEDLKNRQIDKISDFEGPNTLDQLNLKEQQIIVAKEDAPILDFDIMDERFVILEELLS